MIHLLENGNILTEKNVWMWLLTEYNVRVELTITGNKNVFQPCELREFEETKNEECKKQSPFASLILSIVCAAPTQYLLYLYFPFILLKFMCNNNVQMHSGRLKYYSHRLLKIFHRFCRSFNYDYNVMQW